MSSPLALIVASSLGWAALDALRKTLAARVPALALAALLALGQLPLFLAWLVASGSGRFDFAGYALPGAATVLLNSAAAALFVRALQLSPLSATIPFLSFTPVFAALFSAGLLGERPRLAEAAGIGLVAAGALLVNLRPGGGAPLAALLRERGSLLMTGVALLWSLTAVLDKRALVFATPAVHAAVQSAGVAGVLLLALAARAELAGLGQVSGVRRTYALALLVGGLALAFQFLALRVTLVGVLEALKRSIGMSLAVVVGRAVFHEPLSAGKIAGIALMSAGVTLIVA